MSLTLYECILLCSYEYTHEKKMLCIDVQSKQPPWNLNLESKASEQPPHISITVNGSFSFVFQTQTLGLEF